MAGTFSQIYIQVVFAVSDRKSLIHQKWEEELYKYIAGIVRNKEQKLLAINGMPDHIHIFIEMRPACCLADLVREIKKSTNQFINESKFSRLPFKWQEGYGAFSYSHSQIDAVIRYILNQKEHHKKESFKDEYLKFLNEFGISFDERYLFKWIE